MGMTKTMLQEDLNTLRAEQKNRKEIVELFYQRLYKCPIPCPGGAARPGGLRFPAGSGKYRHAAGPAEL